jgi:hypothetical protein
MDGRQLAVSRAMLIRAREQVSIGGTATLHPNESTSRGREQAMDDS